MRQKQGQKRQIPVLFGILKKYRKKRNAKRLKTRFECCLRSESMVDVDGGSAAMAGPVETSFDLESLA